MSEEETYTGEFKIKNEVGKNLLETYEVNGRTYTDNLPKNCFISIPKKQYIEYEQQKEEIERLNKQIEEYQKALDETTSKKIDLENIIKEAIEYIKWDLDANEEVIDYFNLDVFYNKLLEILDKGV